MIPQRRALTPKNVLLDMLRMTRHEAIAAKSLVDTGKLFGFNGNAIRVALTRLVSSGIVESDERGYYRLSSTSEQLNDFLDTWRLGDKRLIEWDTNETRLSHVFQMDSIGIGYLSRTRKSSGKRKCKVQVEIRSQ